MAEPVMYRPKEWVVQIKEMLAANDNSLAKAGAVLRVPISLRNMKPEAYIPEIVCFGPYHSIDSCSAGSKISMAEAYKGKSAAIISQKLRHYRKSFNDIVRMMELMLPEIGYFYDWLIKDGEYSKNFALAMTVDSCFLLLFLLGVDAAKYPTRLAKGDHSSADAEMISFFSIYESSIAQDIMKLENQIPLSVLKALFEIVKEALISGQKYRNFNQLLFQTVLTHFPPFWTTSLAKDPDDGETAREPHLLGCMHAFVSRFLHMQQRREDERTLLQKCNHILEELVIGVCYFFPTLSFIECPVTVQVADLSARRLAMAGIKFKPFCRLSDNIRLDKYSSTLYLPHIAVAEMKTEVFLRNMVALEFNNAARPKSVTRYVGLMGCLIQSPDDVRLLRDRQVITPGNFALTDECIVKMWHDVRQPFLRTPFYRIPGELSEAIIAVLKKNYIKSKVKRMVGGFFDYVSSWKFMAPVGVFLGLTVTAVQTYCSLYHCTNSIN